MHKFKHIMEIIKLLLESMKLHIMALELLCKKRKIMINGTRRRLLDILPSNIIMKIQKYFKLYGLVKILKMLDVMILIPYFLRICNPIKQLDAQIHDYQRVKRVPVMALNYL